MGECAVMSLELRAYAVCVVVVMRAMMMAAVILGQLLSPPSSPMPRASLTIPPVRPCKPPLGSTHLRPRPIVSANSRSPLHHSPPRTHALDVLTFPRGSPAPLRRPSSAPKRSDHKGPCISTQ
ncbi:hypothetical protein GSI_14596 [Ganoderma sinense ZZ0214-1]|uniref:Uncharacterized protein n=1 Tax=Ganoderma sinense ZZ0214-1 TaxID=1077348 RepID=A0A2G8RP56_9APHY|nr:hypothetical protein GSI_14596 [Ganoderma sinense ZZ0214-1]